MHEFNEFHGKAIALDANDLDAPFRALFIIHEMRVRGFHPFEPLQPTMPVGNPWQDWISEEGAVDGESGSFIRDAPLEAGKEAPTTSAATGLQLSPMIPGAGPVPSNHTPLQLNENVIADILAATRASASWKACVEEGGGTGHTDM